MTRILSLILLFTYLSQNVDAQLLRSIKKRTEQKIKQRAEEKIVEGISEELARRAMRPLDKAFDDMIRQSYRDQYGTEFDTTMYAGDPKGQAAHMNSMLNLMYGTAELQEEYIFYYVVEVEITDFGEEKPQKIKMLIDPDGNLFGIDQKEGKSEKIMVFDIKNDQVIMFDKKEKTAMAIPNVMKMASIYGQRNAENVNDKIISFKRLSDSKKILDYLCQGYEMETEAYSSIFYSTQELPFNWSNTFGSFAQNISPNFTRDNSDYPMNSMLMEGITKSKEESTYSKWLVKKVSEKKMRIKSKDYELQNLMSGN